MWCGTRRGPSFWNVRYYGLKCKNDDFMTTNGYLRQENIANSCLLINKGNAKIKTDTRKEEESIVYQRRLFI